MDVALMQFVAEAQAAAPPKGAGKTAASQSKDGGEFGAMFAGLVAAGSQQTGETKMPDAETLAAGEPAPGLTPGMWNVAALLAQLPQTTVAGQQATPQAAQPTTGAISPLTAAADQTAQPVQPQPQPLPLQQFSVPATGDALQQKLPEAKAQPAELESAPQVNQQVQQAPAVNAAQTLPARPEMKTMPATTPMATVPTPVTDAQTVPVPTEAIPAPAGQPAIAATGQETAVEQQVKPTVITQAAITAAIAGGQRQPEKPVITQSSGEAEADAKPQIAPAAVKTVSASGETQAAGDDSSALTAESFPPAAQNAAPPPETPAANQVFATLVDQAAGRVNAAESTFSAAGNQTASAQDPHNVAQQIVDHARLINRAESSEMVIKLKPEHLGELTLKIVVDSGAVSATFHSPNSEVRAAIEASLPQLKHDMANQGLKVDNVGVYTSLDHFFANDQRHAPQQQMTQTTRRTNGDEAFSDTVATVAAISAQTSSGGTGIDYRI